MEVYPQAKFGDEYKKKYSKNPEPFAAQAYDATAILLKAIEVPPREASSPAARR